MNDLTRRGALAGLIAAGLGGPLLSGAASADDVTTGLVLGDARPFSFDLLKTRARAMANEPWRDPQSPYADLLERIDYNAFFQIVFRRDHALWANGRTGAPVQLFHLGKYSKEPCSIHVVEGGQSREVLYRQSYFDMPLNHVARLLPDDVGFAGFRVMAADQSWDWLAFMGASYFRSPGSGRQYGLSARGLAIDTGLPTPEEFPRFTAFWIEAVPGKAQSVTIYALLDGISVTGAYRFDCARNDSVIMDVSMELYPRRPIERLGIAPLTSMFWYSEKDRANAPDWRPEIHDSDGLAVWTGVGERIWRPLNNPPRVMTNSFLDENPRGFGFLQRDRNFQDYQDDAVFYDRRPSLWVEPLGKWGRGSVQLVEIPTVDEIHDNVVAYWVPEAPVLPGSPLAFSYRLHWRDGQPYPPATGTVVENFIGEGGNPGEEQARPRDLRRFVVDFTGGALSKYGPDDGVVADVTASSGILGPGHAYPIVGQPGRFRALFDLQADGTDAVNLRLYLRIKDQALTETWLFQYFPDDPRRVTTRITYGTE